MGLNWDIFCRVVDNFGDIGVCWRLARQLANEHGRRVRLWVDELAALRPLCPAIDTALDRQSYAQVDICRWPTDFPACEPADVVIEAFACDLPATYLQAMAGKFPRPCWVNLEYLTAEGWAESWHGMTSPHPTLPLVKYFYFPGFSPVSGGLLRESDLLAARAQFLSSLPTHAGIEISLFCYETAPVGDLLVAMAASDVPMLCHVPPGKPLAAVRENWSGDSQQRLGMASIQPIPFLPMDDYDRLLWRCDINFVRGEDSFVRAQWAGKPFIWQPYRQDDDAHLVKLLAFLDRYCAHCGSGLENVLRDMFMAWNGQGDVGAAWLAFVTHLEEIARHNARWCETLSSQVDLASTLVNFCQARV